MASHPLGKCPVYGRDLAPIATIGPSGGVNSPYGAIHRPTPRQVRGGVYVTPFFLTPQKGPIGAIGVRSPGKSAYLAGRRLISTNETLIQESDEPREHGGGHHKWQQFGPVSRTSIPFTLFRGVHLDIPAKTIPWGHRLRVTSSLRKTHLMQKSMARRIREKNLHRAPLANRTELRERPDAEHDLAHDLLAAHTAHGGVTRVDRNLAVVAHHENLAIGHLVR